MPNISNDVYAKLLADERELRNLLSRLNRERDVIHNMFTVREGEAIFETKDGLVCKGTVPMTGGYWPLRVQRVFSINPAASILDSGAAFTQVATVTRNYELERYFGYNQVPLYIET